MITALVYSIVELLLHGEPSNWIYVLPVLLDLAVISKLNK